MDQELGTIGPQRYESKTVPGGRNVGRPRRRPLDNGQPASLPKRARGCVCSYNCALHMCRCMWRVARSVYGLNPPREGAVVLKALSHGYPTEHPFNKVRSSLMLWIACPPC